METQKIVNLLNNNDVESRKLVTRKWYVINDLNNTGYGGRGNNNPKNVKFETKGLKPNLCDYSDAVILVLGKITTVGGDNATKVAFKNCAPFTKCVLQIHVETVDNLDIIAPMYNLVEYSDNYQDSSATIYQFKRDEAPDNNAEITINNSSSFKYKFDLLGEKAVVNGNLSNTVEFPANQEDNKDAGRKIDNAKIVVPLKYLSNFFRALEMPLVNCKLHLDLTWKKECVLSNIVGATRFRITDTKLYVPVVTLSAKDNASFIKQQNDGFKRSVYWNEYKSVGDEGIVADAIAPKRIQLDPSFQGVNRLFVLTFNDIEGDDNRVERNSHRKFYLPRVDIKDYNVIIDGRSFYDNPISSQIEKYNELRKVILAKGDDYTRGCLLDYDYFKKKLSINCS